MEVESSGSRVLFNRDFPPGCGRKITQCKGFRSDYTRDFPPGCGPNVPKNVNIFKEMCLGGGKIQGSGVGCGKPPSHLGSSGFRVSGGGSDVRNLNPKQYLVKNPPKVKLMEPIEKDSLKVRLKVGNSVSERGKEEKLEVGSSEGVSGVRKKVLDMLEVFRKRCDELKKKGVRRVDVEADKELRNEGKLVKENALRFGSIPGVEVGDKFFYRIEVVIVGLHRLYQGGIDSMECGGERYATCIIANEGHMDKMNDPNVLVYIGEGGTAKRNEPGLPPDQQLIGGNLALHNSKKAKKPVRVVRGLRYGASNSKIVYVYDGLYEVGDDVKKKGPHGNMIFEFRLIRIPGQPVVPWINLRRMFN